MQTLDSFLAEEAEKLKKFRKWWLAEHKKNPEYFPLAMEDGNEGQWVEQLLAFGDFDK